jgi:hypothetical protein
MITNVGRAAITKNIARGNQPLIACAIGDGGSDPVYATDIAASINDVQLAHQIYFSPTIDVIESLLPPVSDYPRVRVTHAFFASLVVPSGTPVSYIDEFGVFTKDPDTGLYVMVYRETFPRRTFRVPATGISVSRDTRTVTTQFGIV